MLSLRYRTASAEQRYLSDSETQWSDVANVAQFSQLAGICAKGGADAHVRGRPPGRPLRDAKPMNPQQERDEGVPRRPGGLPHLISAGIPDLQRPCGIKLKRGLQHRVNSPEATP